MHKLKLWTHLLVGLHICSVLCESHFCLCFFEIFLCVFWKDDLKVVLGSRK